MPARRGGASTFHLNPSGGRRLQIDRVLVSYFDTEVLQRLSPPNHRPSEYREYGSLAEVADKIRAALHGRSGDAVHRVLPAGGMVSVLHYFSATFARTKRAVHKLQRKAAVTPFMLLDGVVASWLRCHLVPTASRVCVCVCVFVYVRVSVCVAALLPYIVPIVVATLAGRRFRTLFGALPCVYACALQTPHHRHCLVIVSHRTPQVCCPGCVLACGSGSLDTVSPRPLRCVSGTRAAGLPHSAAASATHVAVGGGDSKGDRIVVQEKLRVSHSTAARHGLRRWVQHKLRSWGVPVGNMDEWLQITTKPTRSYCWRRRPSPQTHRCGSVIVPAFNL